MTEKELIIRKNKYGHVRSIFQMGRKSHKKPIADEYVVDEGDTTKRQLEKSLLRQRNLQQMVQNSQVVVVSNPYLVSLDGLPSLEFVFDDIRKAKNKKGVPQAVKV